MFSLVNFIILPKMQQVAHQHHYVKHQWNQVEHNPDVP